MSLVVVYGATGWTGRQVVRALVGRGLQVALAGRSIDRLERLAAATPGIVGVRHASLRDARSVRTALAGASVVVNCAGPFLHTGALLVAAALEAKAHYLDVSGEGSYVGDVHRDFHDLALARNIAVCPGFAAKGALGDWAANLAFQAGALLDEVCVAYAHGLREYLRPSVGSALASAGQGFFRGAGWSARSPAQVRRFSFPPPFGAGLSLPVTSAEDWSVPRHVPARRVQTFLSVDPGGPANEHWARLSRAAYPLLPLVGDVMASTWGRYHLHLFAPTPEAKHERDTFGVTVELRANGRVLSRAGLVAHDAYASTAEIVALGVVRLMCGSTAPGVDGVLAPSELCDANAALEALEQVGAVKVYQDAAGT